MIYRKNLPGWLEEFIYKDLGGSYEPDRNAFQNNLFSDEEKKRERGDGLTFTAYVELNLLSKRVWRCNPVPRII